MGALRTSYPRFRREGGAAPLRLTGDDTALLHHIYRHRFLRAEHLYRLFPHRSADRLSRRLMTLFRAGYLDRPLAQIDRFREGGSSSLVYGLGAAGAAHLKATLGVSIAGANWKARNRSYIRENLDHTLAVARFLVDVELACRARDDLIYIPFEELIAAILSATAPSTKPGRWPVPVRWQGVEAEVHVVPDAIFALRMAAPDGSKTAYFLVEVDRGTMTIAPAEQVQRSEAFLYRATLLRKFLAYAESWKRELHTRYLGIHAPRVLFITTSLARAASMQRVAEQALPTIPPGIFLFGVQSGANDPLLACYVDIAGQTIRLTRE